MMGEIQSCHFNALMNDHDCHVFDLVICDNRECEEARARARVKLFYFSISQSLCIRKIHISTASTAKLNTIPQHNKISNG